MNATVRQLSFPWLLVAVAAALLAAGGCDTYDPAGVERQYVVEAYLQAGARLPPVRLSRTAPISGTYDPTALAVRGARVRIRRLDGDERQVISYHEAPDRPGVYLPTLVEDGRLLGSGVVEPLGHYRLEVEPPEGDGIDVESVTAETVVPDTFRIVRTSGDTLVWQEDELQVTVTRSQYPGRDARYVVTTTALEAVPANLTPLAAQALERAEEDALQIEDLSVTESPVINEGNYEVRPDGTLTIDLPWLVVNFYGPNGIAIRALGENYYDFLRSQQVQQGGSTFSPGEIPNVIERVNGGTGLFGSYAEVRYDLEVQRPGD